MQDHIQETATKGAPGGDLPPGPVPSDQVSPYGPGRETEPEAEAEAPGEETEAVPGREEDDSQVK